jgi:hypothetical protein
VGVLRIAAVEEIASYQVPRHVWLRREDELSLRSSGKVDTALLRMGAARLVAVQPAGAAGCAAGCRPITRSGEFLEISFLELTFHKRNDYSAVRWSSPLAFREHVEPPTAHGPRGNARGG